MARFKDIVFNNFQGLNEDENPHALGDLELRAALNVWRRGRTIGTRPGTQREQDIYSADLSGGTQVFGMADFRRDRDATRNLVSIRAGAIHTAPTTTLDLTTQAGGPVVVTNTAGNPWTFTQHKDILYAAGGDISVDTPWYWDPSLGTGDDATVLAIPDITIPTNRHPRWIFEWSNYLFAGGFDDYDNAVNAGVVRYSALNDGTVWPVGNSIGGFSAVGGLSSRGDEFLTGMNAYQDNQGSWGLILSNKRIYPFQQLTSSLTPFRLTGKIDNGCVSHWAYVNLGLDSGEAVFLSEQGIHSLRQSQKYGAREDAFLSFKIRNTFETLNRSQLKNAVGAYWREQGLVIFAVATESNSFNDTILALDVRDIQSGSALDPGQELTAENARWYVWKLGDDADHSAAMLLSAQNAAGDWKIFGGNYKKQVFEFTESIYSDMGEGYSSSFRTKDHTFDTPGKLKVLGDHLVDIQPGGSYKPLLRTYFDFGQKSGGPYQIPMPSETPLWGPTGGAMWGQFKWGGANVNLQSKIYVAGAGDSVAWEFSHAGVNEPFYVAQLMAQVTNAGEASSS